jgi:predicted DNA-binding transcriptional regulator AlpA
MLSIRGVAAKVGVSTATIRRWWLAGKFPAPAIHLEKTLRWSEEAVAAWIDQHKTAREQPQPEAIITN